MPALVPNINDLLYDQVSAVEHVIEVNLRWELASLFIIMFAAGIWATITIITINFLNHFPINLLLMSSMADARDGAANHRHWLGHLLAVSGWRKHDWKVVVHHACKFWVLEVLLQSFQTLITPTPPKKIEN